MAMYRFFQTEEDGVWFPVPDGQNAVEDAKRQGAKKLSILAVDKPLDGTDAKKGNSYKGPLYFDIDLPDVEDAIASAMVLINKLTGAYETPLEAIQIYASGSKGLHVLVDQRAFMGRRVAVKDLPLIYRAMAAELYVSGLDFSPYALGRNNTFRIANLKRYDGNYRVPVRFHELQALDAAGYRQLVSAPRHEVTFPAYEGEYSVALNLLFSTASDQVARYEKELTDRARAMAQGSLEKISQHAPPCVEGLAYQKGLNSSTTFNSVALNLALWAARAGVPDIERDRVFALTADHAEPSPRYPNARARRQELEGKYRFALNSIDYKFGCGAMRALLKAGRRICEGCPLEEGCKESTAAEFYSDMAERLGVIVNESGYVKLHGKGKTEPISTFVLHAEAAYMEEQTDGTGMRRKGTLCRVVRHGDELGRVVMDEYAWASKSTFLRALEGIPGVYYTGGDAEVQKIKMLVFVEEESMPEIYQVQSAGVHITQHKGTNIFTYVEPGKSLNGLHMVDTHRLTKTIRQPPALFKQRPVGAGDETLDLALSNLCRSHEPAKVAVILGWYVACHLKAHLRKLHNQFPLLSVWGGSGAGKSKLNELMATLHGLDCNENSKVNCVGLNRFNAIEVLSSSTSVPRLLEEYNLGKVPEPLYVLLGELFKACWGAEAASRGTVIPGKGSVSMEIPLTAPIVIMSEQAPKMPALQERTLIIMLKKSGRRATEYSVAYNHRTSLMQLGQYLMQRALRMPLNKVDDLLNAQGECVSTQWDFRPRYSLMVVHMALAWLREVCADLNLPASMKAVSRLKNSLAEVTRGDDQTAATDSGVARSAQTEVDLLLIRLNALAVESGAVMQDMIVNQQQPNGRRIWLNPRYDYRVAGDQLYLWGENCHARFVEWTRATGIRTPLSEWSDVRTLIEHEPYFVEWKAISGFAFDQPVMVLSIPELAKRQINVTGMRRVYDALGVIELEA